MPIRRAITVRRARISDAPHIRALQDAAFRIAAREDYDDDSIDSFLTYVGTLGDAQIETSAWFVAVIDDEIVASGGWSASSPAYVDFIRGGAELSNDDARIGGLYVDPAYQQTGLAKRLLQASESDIRASGYTGVTITTTYAGIPLLTGCGFLRSRLVTLDLPNGCEFRGLSMRKELSARVALAA